MRKHLVCFDLVDFVRENWRTKTAENFTAVWLRDESGAVYVYFGRIDTEFVRAAEVDVGFDLGFTVREVYPESSEYPAPKGYSVCPERRVILRPQIGGYASEEIQAVRDSRKADRLRKLGLS